MNLLRAWLAGLPAYLWSGWGAIASLCLLLAAWEAKRAFGLSRCHQLIAEMRPAAGLDLAMVSVALRELRALI